RMHFPTRSLAWASLAALTLAACLKGTSQLGTDTGPTIERCEGGGSPENPGNNFTYTDPPGIDTNKQIADLSTDEATAWCTWLVETAWHPGPPPHDGVPWGSSTDGPWIQDGYLVGAETWFTSTGPNAICLERPSVHDCVENLAVTHCGATVKALD